MSGYKRATVKISEAEYRRLHQADVERRFKTHTKTQEKTFRQVAGLTQTLREMENRQQQLEHALSTLDQDSDWGGVDMLQDVLAQNARCYEKLTAIIDETNSNTEASFVLLSQKVTEEMQREREQYHYHLQALTRQLDTYAQREQSKAEAARQWLRQSVAYADFVQTQLDHERFLPGRLFGILGSLNFAQANLAQGFYEASLQTSQRAFIELSELHFELEQRTLEWQTEYEQARSTLTQFVAELEINSSVNAFGLEGEELPEQVDLSYWSNGKFGQLLDKSRQLLGVLTQEDRSISREELRQTHLNLLPAIRERFESIIYEARLNALNSQLRMNIAERALQALEIHGFRLNESGYMDKDMRAGFTATLENTEGSRVMIEVLPAQKAQPELTNELVVITNHPSLKTEHEARLQWQELCRTLNEYDLRVSRPEVRATPTLTGADVESHTQLTQPQRQSHVR
jgi:hypothetical protein